MLIYHACASFGGSINVLLVDMQDVLSVHGSIMILAHGLICQLQQHCVETHSATPHTQHGTPHSRPSLTQLDTRFCRRADRVDVLSAVTREPRSHALRALTCSLLMLLGES
jgi:hypothetical protein